MRSEGRRGCTVVARPFQIDLMLRWSRPAPPAGRPPRLIIDNPGPAARPRARAEIIGVVGGTYALFSPPHTPRARGHGSRLWLCWLRVPRDHRTHTLPERHCKQAMLARGRWQATFTRDTTVLLPRSCTGFFSSRVDALESQVQFCWQEAHGERHEANHIGGASQRRIAVQWQPQIRPAGTRRQEERQEEEGADSQEDVLDPASR